MQAEQSLIPSILRQRTHSSIAELLALATGFLLLCLLAQITVPLSWTPVPITGQTFGVAFVSLLWGRRRAFAIVGSYIFVGALGAPIFAQGGSGFGGPTSGYLIGMVMASFFVGRWADLGWAASPLRAWVAVSLGSVMVFGCGLSVLSLYLPASQLLLSGLWPFLPGDLLKNLLASQLANRTTSHWRAS